MSVASTTGLPAELPPGAGGTATHALPDWYPAWARELGQLYFSGTTNLFVVHGNVRDFVAQPADGLAVIAGNTQLPEKQIGKPVASSTADSYGNLSDFLATQVFGGWDIVLHYDLGRGLKPLAGSDPERLRKMMDYLISAFGGVANWPHDPDKVLAALDQLLERNLLVESAGKRKSIAIIFDYAQYLIPAGDLASLARGQASRLVRLLSWAQNPYLKRVNVATVMVTEKLSEINDRLVTNPHVASLEVPLPAVDLREAFTHWVARDGGLGQLTEYTADQVARLANGLSLTNLNVLLSQARHSGELVDAHRFRNLKKSMIERQCQGLLEFVEPPHTLDLLVGQEAAKQRLKEDAEWILKGHFDAAPMGYLICGPVGTGKTFLAECYAGSIGIPCVKLRNFRSKYVGESEGNLEQMLKVLRSLGPVVVIIDEADAALGSREDNGDSGTSGRIFSMIASQMGDTTYRGKIVWMLLTSRPDLLPIDLKRQGRAEVHIPLFYPQTESETRQMFEIMAKKNKVKLAAGAVEQLPSRGQLSGADIESVVLAGKRRVMIAGSAEMSGEVLQAALADFVPSAQGLEKEKQELAAVLECTQLNFLPESWRAKLREPGGVAQLQERLVAIKQMLSD